MRDPHITDRLHDTANWLQVHPEVTAANIALVSHYPTGTADIMLARRDTRDEAAQTIRDLTPTLGHPTKAFTNATLTHVWWEFPGVEVTLAAPSPALRQARG